MIYSYKRGKMPLVSYTKDVPFLNKKILFKKGLNIIVGPNGSGKTALLQSIAHLFLSQQVGYTSFERYSILGSGISEPYSDKIEHDGLPVISSMKKEYESLSTESTEQIKAFLVKCRNSSGQYQRYLLHDIFENSKVISVDKEVEKYKKSKIVCRWYEWFKKGRVSNEGPITLLMDEPTKGFDYFSVLEFWKSIPTINLKYQLIISTHDLFVFVNKIENANYIETEKGYIERVVELYNSCSYCMQGSINKKERKNKNESH